MKLEGRFWITRNGQNLAGEGRIDLLARIADCGSITRAAKAVGMSYKAAWDAVDAMNKAAGEPLVERSVGGKGGGGTRLTAAGCELIERFRRQQREHRRFLANLEEGQTAPGALRTSARNQLTGRVLAIRPGDLCDEVELGLAGDQRLLAAITHGSTERLGLSLGDSVVLLVKAPWVRLVGEGGALQGELLELRRGASHSEAQVELPGGVQLTALLDNDAADAMRLRVGQRVGLQIDPQQVILCL